VANRVERGGRRGPSAGRYAQARLLLAQRAGLLDGPLHSGAAGTEQWRTFSGGLAQAAQEAGWQGNPIAWLQRLAQQRYQGRGYSGPSVRNPGPQARGRGGFLPETPGRRIDAGPPNLEALQEIMSRQQDQQQPRTQITGDYQDQDRSFQMANELMRRQQQLDGLGTQGGPAQPYQPGMMDRGTADMDALQQILQGQQQPLPRRRRGPMTEGYM
jgi:hypothetical protein